MATRVGRTGANLMVAYQKDVTVYHSYSFERESPSVIIPRVPEKIELLNQP